MNLPRRRSRVLLPTILILLVLFGIFALFTTFYTEFLWYASIGFTKVFTTSLLVRIVLFLLFGALMAALVTLNFVIAYRTRPMYAPMSPEQQNLERYRQGIEPFRRVIPTVVAALVFLLAGSAGAGEWRTFLLWRNGSAFGQVDPQFHKDLAFFVFDLPWYRFVLGFGFAIVVVSLVVAAATHYMYGGLRLQSPGERTSNGARIQLSVLFGLFVLFKAVAYWIDRYQLSTKEGRVGRSDFVGLTFTDVNAVLPAKAILAAIALICALLFFAAIVRPGWLLPGVGVALLLLSAVIIGSVYPAIVQRFNVRPSEQEKESPYIQRNIDGTRAAYNIAGAEKKDYPATTNVSAGQLRDDADLIPGIRLLDPAIVSPAFRQLQQVRGYYKFPDVLDVDRYQLGSVRQDSVVAVREIDLGGVPPAQRNWINDHLIYTHGFGIVAGRGNTRNPDGRPSFFESDIPPSGALGAFEPRVYFGESSPSYSIVGAPTGSGGQELDYPDDTSNTGQRNNTYAGKGGVPVGSPVRKMLYAAKFQEANILLSNQVNSASRILYDRTPRERVHKVAPWLKLDGNVYPAVVNGRILWILDGYTTSDDYPYANRTSLETATADALTRNTSAVVAQADEQVNYIRNSVKATVDAYDGTVTLYQWDDKDPILKAWSGAFGGTVTPKSQISAELLQHLRYPEDLFKVQRSLLSQYHVTTPQEFFSGQDFWRVPVDPTTSGQQRVEQPPYYLTLQMPGQQNPTFSLTTTFVPRGARDNLTAFAAVDAEPGPEYGKIRVLVLPRNTTVPGPGQVYNQFEADPDVASQLSLLRRGGSEVQNGNVLTLPMGGGLLYVEPVYVRASGGTASYPLLQKVLVGFGDRIGFANTLQQALDQVFLGNSGTGGGTTPPPSGGGTKPGAGAAEAALAAALQDMRAAIDEGNQALRSGNFAAYGVAQQRLQAALNRAVAAERQLSAAQRAKPTPTPRATPPRPSATAAAASPAPPAATAPTATGAALGAGPRR